MQDCLPDQAAGEDADALVRGQRSDADQVDQVCQAVRLRQQTGHGGAPTGRFPLGSCGRAAGQDVGVTGEGVRPRNCRVVAGIGQVPVQCPQAAHEPFGVRGDRLGHIAAGWGDRTDDRHRTGPRPQRRHRRGSLVERREGGGQTGRIALFRGERAGPGRELLRASAHRDVESAMTTTSYPMSRKYSATVTPV